MSKTLSYTDTINRVGYTEIDGKRVVQHVCSIDAANPQNMSFSNSKLNKELYRENLETCRADIQEFEDLAFELQEKYIAMAEESAGGVGE